MLRRFPYFALLVVTEPDDRPDRGALPATQPGPQGKEKGDKEGKGKKGGDDIERFGDRLERLRADNIQSHDVADPERQALLWHSRLLCRPGRPESGKLRSLICADPHALPLPKRCFMRPTTWSISRSVVGTPASARRGSPASSRAGLLSPAARPITSSRKFTTTQLRLSMLHWPRQCYQRAVQSYDRSDFRGWTDEYGKNGRGTGEGPGEPGPGRDAGAGRADERNTRHEDLLFKREASTTTAVQGLLAAVPWRFAHSDMLLDHRCCPER